jgi:uncharacterized delta-60 repeat protein
MRHFVKFPYFRPINISMGLKILEKCTIGLFLLFFSIWVSGCAFDFAIENSSSSETSRLLLSASSNTIAPKYSGSLWADGPGFFLNDPSLDQGVTLNLEARAFEDAGCSNPASGILNNDQQELSYVDGVTSILNLSYTSNSSLEDLVYIKGSLQSDDSVSSCFGPIRIIKNFVEPGVLSYTLDGGTVSGLPGADGYDSPRSVAIDAQGRIVAAGYARDINDLAAATVWRFLPDGSIDESFGNRGSLMIRGNNEPGLAGASVGTKYDRIYNIKIDQQGRYVMAGFSRNSRDRNEPIVIRMLPDGTLDTSFAGTGVYRYQPDGPGFASTDPDLRSGIFDDLEVDDQGRIWVAGSSYKDSGGRHVMALRLLDDGTLDPEFSDDGFHVVILPGDEGMMGFSGGDVYNRPWESHLDSKGRLVITLWLVKPAGDWLMGLVRFLPDGSLDPSLGGQGFVVVNEFGTSSGGRSGTNRIDWGFSIDEDHQGKIVVAGMTNQSSPNRNNGIIWRFNEDGSPDLSFHGVGFMDFRDNRLGGTSGGNDDEFYALKIDAQGRYVMGGWAPVNSAGYHFVICRVLPSGDHDTSFGDGTDGTPGCSVYKKNGPNIFGDAASSQKRDFLWEIAIDSAGRITAVGETRNLSNNAYHAAVGRWKEDGTMDTE